MGIIIPVISDIDLPTPPVLPAAIAPFVWQAYGTLVQDYLDGRIRDTAAYFAPLAIVYADLALEKDKTFRKYHRARKEMLAAEGRKNLSLMPGYLQRKLMDLTLDEKRELSEATAKIAARYAETSLTSFYDGAGQALQSDALRSEMHFKVQSASFEVAKAALMAAYEYAGQRVKQFEATLKAIETEFKLISIEYKAQGDALEVDIAAVRIAILAAENIGDAEELQRLAAELAVAYKRVEEVRSQLPLIAAEVQKALASLDVLRAEQALATFKELTAMASMEKSQARLADIPVTERKIALELAKVGLQADKDDADTASELSVIEARGVEEELDNAKATISIINTEADAELLAIKTDMTEDDTTAAENRKLAIEGRALALKSYFENRGTTRESAISGRATTEVSIIDARADDREEKLEARADARKSSYDERGDARKSDLETRADTRKSDLETRAEATESEWETRADTRKADIDQRATDADTEYANRYNARKPQIEQRASDRENKLDTEATEYSNHINELIGNGFSGDSGGLETKIKAVEEKFDDWKDEYADALTEEANGILAAANAAANADVSSTFIYNKGEGTPPTPSSSSPPEAGEPW